MEVLHPKCAGLDVHKDTVVASVRIQGEDEQLVQTFGTSTRELEKLAAYLTRHEVTHVAMEATGSYWKPVWAVLSVGFELLLANAAQVKAVPGRKTDVNDAMWVADLDAHGLIRASFVPTSDIQALRDLTRTRKQYTRQRSSAVQRIDKVLQTANVKLTSVLSDIMGVSGRAILDAIVAGTTDPAKLVRLVNSRVRTPRAKIVEALHGRITDHHRLMIELHLSEIDNLDKLLARIDAEVGKRLEPFRQAVKHVKTIPGVSDLSASVIVSEIGVDMSRFPTSGHLISWAGLCPKNDESAGKRRSTRLRQGDTWLKTNLVQCAWAAVRSKGTYLQSQFFRLKSRRGPRKAIMAIAASILTSIYHMLANGVPYVDLGPQHFNNRERTSMAKRLERKLNDLGYDVTLVERKAA